MAEDQENVYTVTLDDTYYLPDYPDEDDPQSTETPSYRDGTSINLFRFTSLNELIGRSTAKYCQPRQKAATREQHNKTHREVWAQIQLKAADEAIPDQLFDPPRTFVQVSFVSWPRQGHYCCPCDFEASDVRATVEIRAPDGITKEVFLTQVAEALYGENYTVGGTNDRPVVKEFDYMSTGGLMGDIWACTVGLP